MKKLLCTALITALVVSPITTFAQDTNEVIPEPTPVETQQIFRAQYGEITSNNVHFRSAPGLSSTIYRQLHAGYVVNYCYEPQVYKDGYYWQQVIYNGVTGWVASNYVKMV